MPTNMDLAVLGLEIRSDGVVTASQRLRELSSQASSAETATSRFTSQQVAAEKASSGLASGLKRAVAAMTALVAGYKSLGAASSFMKTGLDYSSSLEESRIGIATLITSMVKLGDAQGNALTGMEKYSAAQVVAADMMKEIQRLGLETTATTESLVEGVQSIMGPAIQAGMALKDIPKFAVQGAQALQTLGIPLQQMRTELDALLTGRINKSQDVLAPKLFADITGDLGEYIRGLRDSGKLVDEIMARLEPFKLAGADVAQTWRGLTSNFEDAYKTLAASSATDFTASMKQSIGVLSDLILSTEEGSIGISDKFMGIAEVLKTIEGSIGKGILSATEKLAGVIERIGAYINEIGPDKFLENLAYGAKMATAALVALTVARKAASTTFTVSGIGGESQQVTGLREYIAVQNESRKATMLRLKEEEAAALAQKQAAVAARDRFLAEQQVAVGVRNATQAEIIRAAQQKQSLALSNAITAAEVRYQAALKATQAASISATAARTAVSGLVSMLGGPVGIAVTGLTLGLSALLMRTDETSEATEALSRAEKSYSEAIKGATGETGKLNEKLTEAQRLKMELARTDLQAAIDKQFEALNSSFAKVTTKEGLQMSDWWGLADFDKAIPADFTDRFKTITDVFRQGQMTAGEYADSMAKLRQAAIDAGYGNTEFVKTLEDVSRDEGAVSKLVSLHENLARIEGAARGAAGGVKVLQSATNGLSAKLDAAITESGLEAYISGLGKQQQAVAKGLTKDLNLNQQQVQDVLAGKQVEGFDPAKLRQYVDLQKQIYANSQKSSGGGGGASKIDTQRENIRRLRDEIDQLSGTSEKASAAMSKKLDEIGKMGKEAGLSAAEISKLSKEYQEAFKSNALREFDKEILKLSGDSAKLRQLEIAEAMDQWRDRFEAAGMSAEEAAPKLEKMQQALEQKSRFEDLQVAADFYKELGQLSGNYGLSLQYQNQLIDEQARLWQAAGIATEDINARIELMKQEMAQDPFSGFARGARKFGAEYADLAGQVEDLTRNMGNTIANSLADGFMKGKFSAQDFFTSLVSMAAQAVSNYAVGSIFSGLGGMFGFGGGGGFSIPRGTVVGFTQAGAGGGFTGPVTAWHSGGLVGSTGGSFQRSVPLSAFANAPRFHSGGGFFGSDEYPAILKSGERVLNEQETRAYHAGQQINGGVSFSPQIRVNITNASGTPVQAETQAQADGNGNMDLTIILREIDKGMVGLAKSGRSNFTGYMEKAYGISRAGALQRNRA